MKQVQFCQATHRSPVVDWDSIFKKGVRAKNGKDVGIVVGISAAYVFIQNGVTREIVLPKSRVEGFDGNEVYLDLSTDALKRFESKI